MNRLSFVFALAGSMALAAPLAAQGRNDQGIPPGFRPPPGMCRIWIDGVPAGQQPAPTDCATAVRNRPANGRVIFGDDAGKGGRAVKRFGGEERVDTNRRDRREQEQAADERYPSVLPEMIGATLIGRGQRTEDVTRWLGGAAAQARTVDRDRNGLPERVTWLDAAGNVLQVWIDADGDGRADTVEVYRDGKMVRRFGR